MSSKWEVRYHDGTAESENMLGVRWADAQWVRFESDDYETVLELHPLAEQYARELRTRNIVRFDGLTFAWLVLLTYDTTVPIDPDYAATYEAACVEAFYWSPDGQHHICQHFNCPVIRHATDGLFKTGVLTLGDHAASNL